MQSKLAKGHLGARHLGAGCMACAVPKTAMEPCCPPLELSDVAEVLVRGLINGIGCMVVAFVLCTERVLSHRTWR
eukprot:3002592-Amphidinium_carterae.1